MNKSKRNLAFIAIDIACFLTVLDSTIVNVSLPSMATYFNTNTAGISWVSTAYLIAFSALLINFSKIADIFGRKKLFLVGLVLFGVASVCCGLADSLTLLIIFRILQGIGAAILTPLSIPLGIELFGKESMGKLSVIIGMTISISAASGPVIGGILNEFFSYKAIFYVNIPFVLLALVFAALYVQECFDETIEKKVDILGSVLLALGLGTLTFLLVKGNEYGWESNKIIGLTAISVVSIIVFVIYEHRIKNPMIEFNLFKVKSFTASILLIAIFFYAYMPVSYLMNFYFENTLGYTVLKAGLMMGIPSLVALVSAPFMPLMYKKLSTGMVSLISVLIAAAGNFVLAFMNQDNHVVMTCIAFVLLGLGVRITTILYQTTYEEISNDKNGIASGIQNSLRQLSACIAIAIVTTLSSHFTTTAVQNTKDSIVREVNQSAVLEDSIKQQFSDAIYQSQGSFSNEDTKSAIHVIFTQKEQMVLASVPKEQAQAIQQNFMEQEQELDSILDDGTTIKETQTYHVYNKCFLVTGVVALLGLLVVPFNRKKQTVQILIKEVGTEM